MKFKIKDPRSKIHEKGFSILELIIYIAIFAVISTVAVDMTLSLNTGWTKSKVESEVQQNLRFAMETIAQNIQRANAVTVPPVSASGSSLMLTSDGQTIQFFLTGTTLQKQVGASPAENITSDKVKVTYLNFRTLQNTAASNATIVATTTEFAIRMEYNSSEAQFSYTQNATSTERLRN